MQKKRMFNYVYILQKKTKSKQIVCGNSVIKDDNEESLSKKIVYDIFYYSCILFIIICIYLIKDLI